MMNKQHIINLNDEDLDSVVGGAFNQSIISKYNLKVLTGKSGSQGLRIKALVASGSSTDCSAFMSQGPCSEGRLRSLCADPNLKSLEIQNNKGEWVSFSKDQCEALLKG